jgi:hypothetical protein
LLYIYSTDNQLEFIWINYLEQRARWRTLRHELRRLEKTREQIPIADQPDSGRIRVPAAISSRSGRSTTATIPFKAARLPRTRQLPSERHGPEALLPAGLPQE